MMVSSKNIPKGDKNPNRLSALLNFSSVVVGLVVVVAVVLVVVVAAV